MDVTTFNIFEPAEGGIIAPLLRVANALHVRTRPATVRSHLLFAPGDPWNEDRAHETTRNLRDLDFLDPQRIQPVRSGDSVRVLVETRDLWSTVLDFNLERGGGRSSGSLAFTERNLLGYGKEFTFAYTNDPSGISRQGFITDPAVAGTHVRARAGAATGSGGATNEFYFGLPFYAIDTPTSMVSEGRRTTSVAHLYQTGREVATLDQRIERLVFAWGHGTHVDGTVRRLQGSFLMLNRRLGPSRLAPGTPDVFAGGEENLRVRRVSGTFKLWQPHFVERTYIEQMGPIEDFDVGRSATLELGYSPEFFGGTANEGYARAALDAGADSPAGFGWVRASIESRLRSKPREIVRRMDARWIGQPGPGHRLIFSVVGIQGSRVPRNFQVVYGGLNGLRAYPVQAAAGTRAWRFNVEDRMSLTGDIAGQLRVGFAAFYDGARAWGPGAVGTDWFHACGLGVRMSLPHLSPSQVLRVDVAWPVSPSRDGRRNPVLSFGSRQAF